MKPSQLSQAVKMLLTLLVQHFSTEVRFQPVAKFASPFSGDDWALLHILLELFRTVAALTSSVSQKVSYL